MSNISPRKRPWLFYGVSPSENGRSRLIKQSVGDKAYKAAFGIERPHVDERGAPSGKLKIGQKFYDPESQKEKIANFDDVQNSMKNLASNPEQKAKDKLSKYDREQESDKGIEDALERKIELPEDNGY